MSNFCNDDLAVVTGASSGIGAAYAHTLAARGLPLLLVARRKDRLDALAAQLRERHSVTVDVLAADLTQPGDLERLEGLVAGQRISLLVNNAGSGALGPTAANTAGALEALIRLNIIALTRLSLAALAGFRERGNGTLVNIGSVIAFAPSAGGAAYSGSKGYVANFTQSLALEYSESPIRIQLVMPGPVRSEFFSSQGLDYSVFPEASYLAPEQLVAAALAGLDLGEVVTTPALAETEVWKEMEKAHRAYVLANLSGMVAPRYETVALTE